MSLPDRPDCPDAITITDQIGLALTRIARGWRTKMDTRLSAMGLTQAKWVTLYHLAAVERPLMQCELASEIGIEGPTLVRLLDGLEKLDLIARLPSPHDRRGKMIHLTQTALPLLDEINRISADIKGGIFRDIPEAELAQCHAVLLKLQSNLGCPGPDCEEPSQGDCIERSPCEE